MSAPANAPRTRYGRNVKAPARFEPEEEIIDDYTDTECEDDDEEFSDDDDEYSDDDDEEDDDDDEDMDEHGNLKDFVVYSDEEDDDE